MTEEGDFLQIKSIDHMHFWVGNAKQAMYFWWKGFGFKPWLIPAWKPATANTPPTCWNPGRSASSSRPPTGLAAKSPPTRWCMATESKRSPWKWRMSKGL